MAAPLSLVMLRTKRDKIRNTIEAYERRSNAAQADLAHVNAKGHGRHRQGSGAGRGV